MQTDHRPYALPRGPWVMSMRWQHLLFAHWPVPVAALRPLIPAELELDTWHGEAWLGVVPFEMAGVRGRMLPKLPGTHTFAELNVRTYVTAGGMSGVWFFSLDAANKLAVRIARLTFNLPYFDARMTCEVQNDVRYTSTRTHRRAKPADFAARYHPVGEPFKSSEGSLEHFLTERYCLYAANRKGIVRRGHIHHQPWPLQSAEAEFQTLDMTRQIGVTLPDTAPVLHYAKHIDTVAWLPQRIG